MDTQRKEHTGYKASRVYDELISQEEFDNDGQIYDNRQVRASAWSRRYRMCAVSLALLSAALLLVNIGLGVHYGKVRAGQLSLYRNISHMRAELEERGVSYTTASLARDETRKQTQKEITQRGMSSWELDYQRRRSKDYEKQIEKLREEQAELQLSITNIEVNCKYCPVGWVLIAHLCYYFPFSGTISKASWNHGREDCRKRGADLVVIDSFEKQGEIHRIIKLEHLRTRIDYGSGFWIGLRDVEAEGTWKWIDGRVLTRGYWHEGEPNDDHGIEDCAAVYAGADRMGNWNDAPCGHPLKWICEKQPFTSSS